ncbi:hypothetical protein OCK74_12715 [Chitinophagaceae bacterium LB-8]|uniref:Uncharacterized protein n=1 Tax=Paraflavisolibacter caeni TaxID=2982496 RepID=A0A9X2XWK7_9BACT|nr:hypothetical protein [Paraflavisolibacter caeni]MCU7549987.1 hypothetical protein [Paraflavisolibacter caeni]
MKMVFSIVFMTLTVLRCGHPPAPGKNTGQSKREYSTPDTTPTDQINLTQSSIRLRNLFTLPDAERILGEKAHLSDSALTIKEDTLAYKCAYTANATDQKTGKTGNIYFMVEQFAKVSIAQYIYSSIKRANENHEGVKVLHDLGDEAYFHSDRQNFYFILVRKGEKLLRMKVNKTTSATSLDEFNSIARNITAVL